jgi:hypothetical protein
MDEKGHSIEPPTELDALNVLGAEERGHDKVLSAGRGDRRQVHVRRPDDPADHDPSARDGGDPGRGRRQPRPTGAVELASENPMGLDGYRETLYSEWQRFVAARCRPNLNQLAESTRFRGLGGTR